MPSVDVGKDYLMHAARSVESLNCDQRSPRDQVLGTYAHPVVAGCQETPWSCEDSCDRFGWPRDQINNQFHLTSHSLI